MVLKKNIVKNRDRINQVAERHGTALNELMDKVIEKQDKVIKITQEQNQTLHVLEEKESLNFDMNAKILKLLRMLGVLTPICVLRK